MVAAASLILDPAAREQALIEAEAYLCAQMPGMPMYTMTDDYLVKSDLKGIVKNKIGHIYFEYAHFE
jgi:oligopeptide transport system substrate-binding protein